MDQIFILGLSEHSLRFPIVATIKDFLAHIYADENVVFCSKTPIALALQVFQCLLIDGENAGQDAIRNAEGFVITETEFEDFLQRHKDVPCLVQECNDTVSLFEIAKLGL